MQTDDVKPWRCGNGHQMGVVKRNGSKIRQLLLYRQALATGETAQEVDVIAIVEGYVADVRCSVCGTMRTWVPGEEALNKLLKQVRKSRKTAG